MSACLFDTESRIWLVEGENIEHQVFGNACCIIESILKMRTIQIEILHLSLVLCEHSKLFSDSSGK